MRNFISSTETAKCLSINVSTLTRWRKAGQGPPAYRIGKAWKYDEAEVNAFIESCRVAHAKFDEILNIPLWKETTQ